MFAPELFLLGDDAAGDARRSTCASAASNGVNDDGGSAIAEDGVSICAESYVWSDGAGVGGAICGDDQRKVRNVASWRTHGDSFVGVAATAKMGTGGFKI